MFADAGPLVTFDVFMRWKEDRRLRKEADFIKKRQEEEKKSKGKTQLRTGRELFQYDPTLFVDDEEAAAEYEQEEIPPELEEAAENGESDHGEEKEEQ